MRFGAHAKLIAIAFFLTLAVSASAQDIAFEKVSRNIALEKDGTFVQLNESVIRLNTEAGAKGTAQIPIPYSDSLQNLEVVEAYTLVPGGKRIDVKPESIFTQAAPIAVSAPMFNDIKYRIIVFPEPVAGAKLAFKVKISQKTPFFPGHVSFIEAFPTTYVQEDSEIKLSAPSDYVLKFDVRGLDGGMIEVKDGRKYWKWTFKNLVARKVEPNEVAETDFGAYMAVSSFADWADLGKAYLARADDKAKPSDDIKKLAAEITTGAKNKRDEVRMIHQWVSRNVRYVGVFLGLGGFVPRTTTQILETKYGDCKDHTTLTIALLRARGIEATTALIQTASAFQLPKVAVVGAFNHAVAYVSEFDIYLDGTSQFHPWNVLPASDAGKQTLLTGLGKLGATPARKENIEATKSTVKMTIAADGTLTGKSSTISTGNIEANFRARLASIPAGQEDKWVTSWVRRAGPQATGKIIKSDARDLSKPLEFAVEFEVKDAVALDSPGAFAIPKGLTEFSIADIANRATLIDKRTTPFACSADTQVEEFEIALPEKTKILALPNAVKFEGKTIRFESTYRQQNNVIYATRKVVHSRSAEVCPPEMWQEKEELSVVIARDARAQILLQ
jgi:Domain of Unknown Function with PDB structure (DUF3857)/Transglutaminase-like superfamily